MNKLQGRSIYLSTLEREQFRRLFESSDYDMEAKTDFPDIFVFHSVETADQVFDNIKKESGDKLIGLGIFLNEGLIIGDINLHGIEWTNRSAEIGVSIAQRSNRGKGYGREAIGLMLGYSFDILGMERIHANTLEHNAGCRKALEKNGFVLEGVNRRAVYIGGRYYDRILYSILRDEYTAI